MMKNPAAPITTILTEMTTTNNVLFVVLVELYSFMIVDPFAIFVSAVIISEYV